MAHKAKVIKAYKAMQVYGIGEEKVKPVLKTLLSLYDKNWKHIEDENYRVLLDAIFDSADPKSKETKSQEFRLRDEPEECEPPLKTRLRSQKDRSSTTPGGSSSPSFSRSPTPGGSPTNSSLVPYKRKGKKSSSPQIMELSVEPSVVQSPKENMLDKSREEGTCFDDEMCEVPLAVVLQAHPSFLQEDGSSHENFIDAEDNLLGEDSSSAPPCLLHEDGSSNEDFSNLKANGLEILNSQLAHMEGKEDDGPQSSRIDIASAPSGEAPCGILVMAQDAKVAKAVKAMKDYGIAEEKVKPVLKTLLGLHDKNWKHIENENYRVLLEAIFDSVDPQREETKTQEYLLRDEPEECEPQLKRRRRSQKDHRYPSTPDGGLSPSFSRSPTPGGSPTNSSLVPYKRKEKKSLSPQISELPVPSVAYSPNENMLDKSCEEGKHFDDDQPMCEVPLAVVHPAYPSFLEDGSSHENFSDAEENCSNLELMCSDTKDKSPPCLLHQDCSSNEDVSNLKANYLGILNSQLVDMDEKGDHGPKSSRIDIASSPNGEVKIALICNTSEQSKVHIPSIDSVLKEVEERCLKSYRITEPGFSLLNLMKEVCEFFLLKGTSSDGDEQVGPVNVQPTLDVVKTLNRPIVPLNFSNGPVKLHNLIQVLPHIPRSLTSTGFDFLQCIKGVNVNVDDFVGRDKKSKTSDCQESSSSSSMAIAQKDNPYYVVDDITRGEEKNQISLVNEINNECRPTFRYIPKNINYKHAYVKFLLARISDDNCCPDCSGDCTSLEIPCACAGETGGEFAYTPEGLVKEKFLEECISMNRDPRKHSLIYCKDCPLERSKGKRLLGKCKGHLLRRFIKECWHKCGCSFYCGNRVVQRGITVNLQVFMTPEGKGWGLRTLKDLPKGAFVCEYVGEIMTNAELFERNLLNSGEKHTYPVLLDADWGSEGVLKDEEALCLDATVFGNVARFINHRCYDANMVEIPVEVETPDHHYYHLAFFTTRKVNAMEELTWDYGVDFDDHTHPVKAFQCRCGSKFCRKIKRRKRTRSSS